MDLSSKKNLKQSISPLIWAGEADGGFGMNIALVGFKPLEVVKLLPDLHSICQIWKGVVWQVPE